VVARIATITLAERTANHSIAMMAVSATIVIGKARSASEPNSSSDIGASPVSRTVTPCAGSSARPLAAARMASLASAPGSSWV